MNDTQLCEHARWLAENHVILVEKSRDVLLPRLAQNEAVLKHSFRIVESAVNAKQRIVPAANWLLDNFYILEEQIWLARRHLPKSYSLELPIVTEGEGRGFPRVYDLALNLVQCADYLIDEGSIHKFIKAYQTEKPLLLGELWAVPIMLRFSLLEIARQTASRIAAAAIDLRNANYWADQIAAVSYKDSDGMFQVMAMLSASKPRLSSTFMAELARRFQSMYHTPVLAMSWLEQHLTGVDRSLDTLYLAESQQEAADQLSMGHTITSLRMIESIDWRKFVEENNEVDRILAKDPCGAYAKMDFSTRDSYRHAVEVMAKKYHKSQTEVAQAALNLCLESLLMPQAVGSNATVAKENVKDSPNRRQVHVGYYLIDGGRTTLQSTLAPERHSWHQLKSSLIKHGFIGYFLALNLITLLMGLFLIRVLISNGDQRWLTYTLLAASLLVASQHAITLVNWCATLLVRPKRLPRMDYSAHLPDDVSTMVVIPTMLGSSVGIDRLLQNIEVCFLGNRDVNLHFTLLTDFLDGHQEQLAGDDELLACAVAGIEQLNAKYSSATGDSLIASHPVQPFHLYHRPRQWNRKQGLWMGYERKRGKLLEFTAMLRGGSQQRFSCLIGDVSVLKKIRYVITLDTDTRLPHEAARQLVGAMAHPLNQPRIDAKKGRVVEGYAILQPRVAINLQCANRSLFTKLFAGDAGVDPYTREISDVYQDLFGEGSFVGKGIYEVDACLGTLAQRFPENWILSHDLIESCFARSGLISDVILYEDFPSRLQADVSRRHRWVRGDWQNAPWLLPWAPAWGGKSKSPRLSMLSKWKIADNLRRSFVPLAMFVTLVLGWYVALNPIAWTALVLGLVLAPNFILLVHKMLSKSKDNAWGLHLRQLTRDSLTLILQILLSLVFIPYEAVKNSDAVLRSLYRMIISKRHLLEWNPAQEVERQSAGNLLGHVHSMAPTVVFVVVLWLWFASLGKVNALAHVFFAAWALAPLIAWWISEPTSAKVAGIADAERQYLQKLAHDTWGYFDRYTNDLENWLPPDNVQKNPDELIAHRTSPTNIGLAMLSNLCAFDFGFIDLEQLLSRTERTLNSLDKLERHRGHFYNWYDTRSLQPLHPRYISTVDSGNLTASLLTLAIALDQMAAEQSFSNENQKTQMQRLALRSREMGTCDYTFLYNKSRRLFSIGYNVHDHRLDSSFYDLLASEARLASFFAIALGQLPVEHWFALGRLMNSIGRERVLLSWSGSMFEYLMPLLILPDYEGTLLAESHKAAVNCQIVYGKIRDVPWGFSESGYFSTDLAGNYQYRAFGVPGLGFKRGLANDLVVAPYASVIALMIEPKASYNNLRRLEAAGFRGECGFYEAIDYTPGRMPPQQSHAVVKSFMAHHQGMSFLALAHVLLAQPLQRRLAKSSLFQSVALLLEEGQPKVMPFPFYGTETPQVRPAIDDLENSMRIYKDPSPAQPALQLLTNGHYHVMVGSAGDGYSAFEGLMLTRFRADALQRSHGAHCYFRDVSNGRIWSNSYQNARQGTSRYEAIFSEGKAEFKRRDGFIETHTEIAVSPEHNIELRRLHLTNHGRNPCTIELTSYVEVALASQSADEAHPAFNKLFTQTEIVHSMDAILCHRRQRQEHEITPWIFHALVVRGKAENAPSFESNRHTFFSRRRDLRYPAAVTQTLSGEAGCVLDPLFAVRQTVTIAAYGSVDIDFFLGVGTDRSHCLELLGSYRDKANADRIFELSWAHSQIVLQHLNIKPAAAQDYNRLAGLLLYPQPHLRASASVLKVPRTNGQQGLWGYGISGDVPVLLLRINRTTQVQLLRELLAAQAYWRRRGLLIDLIVWNEDESSYRQHLNEEIIEAIANMGSVHGRQGQGGVFVIRPDQISESDRCLLLSVARVIINGQKEMTLANQILAKAKFQIKSSAVLDALQSHPYRREKIHAGAVEEVNLPFMNEEGNEFVIAASASSSTPLPWVNVIANKEFGTVISESGASYTWFDNAHEFRLTPWHNDPVVDPSGEAYYIQDLDSGRYWSPMPWPAGGEGDYLVKHGFGYTLFEHRTDGIVCETWVFVDNDEPVKYVLMRLRNDSGKQRRLSVTGICEWVLGDTRTKTAMHLITDADDGTIYARNPYLTEEPGRTAFYSARGASSWSADRCEVLGDLNNWRHPHAMQLTELSGACGPALDACAALRVPLELMAGATQEVTFILGAGRDMAHARDLAKIVTSLRPPAKVLRTVRQSWRERLSKVTIKTPDAKLDALANGWLLYQTISSRIWARSGFYQSGGAYGFRDQLQDVMALVHAEPELARAQLLRCAEQQFIEGDVLHWWHPPSGRGVRTSFSDDYLWLPLVVAHYVNATGDAAVLDVTANYIEGRLLRPGEESNYDLPKRSEQSATLYDHCVAALTRSLAVGQHGLPLMGCGDWNDGMNLVGIKGQGESVWLAFFLYIVMSKFSVLAEQRNDAATVAMCKNHQQLLKKNINLNAWDGRWYLRAFFDSGEPLGSAQSDECQIDFLPQSWAVLSGAADADKAVLAMSEATARLVNHKEGIIQLFDPPFDHTQLNPGYIKGYPPGIRENGGQYTHAAIWAIWALAVAGDHRQAWQLLNMINPMNHGLGAEGMQRYKVEPYVIAADVYSQAPHAGRGGWTWYTGSASWMYRLIIEGLIGLQRQGDRLRFEPRLNPDWEDCSVSYQYHETHYQISFTCKSSGVGVKSLLLDGTEIASDSIALVNDGLNHLVSIETN